MGYQFRLTEVRHAADVAQAGALVVFFTRAPSHRVVEDDSQHSIAESCSMGVELLMIRTGYNGRGTGTDG